MPMDPDEEQVNELEVLDAIYGADFRITEPATSASGARFQIEITDEVSQDVKLRLVFTHTSSYPETSLKLVVHALEGLSSPRRQTLQTFLEGVAEKNIGLPSVYTVCQAAQEWVEENVIGKSEEQDKAESSKFETLDSTQHDKVEVISSKAVGTPVTVESFAAWREKFMEAVDALKTQEQLEKESNQKMSGREFFDSKTIVVSAESESFWEQEASQMTTSEL